VERLHSSPARRAVAAAEAVEVVEVRASRPVFPVSSHLPSATATILRQLRTLIKKKRKFSSYIRKFRRDRVQSHI
jgi:hypothetical protein